MKILSAAQMREVDRLTVERYGVPSLELMENAGRHVAEFVEGHFSGGSLTTVAVLCGKGNNGGDGFVVARRLYERGWQVNLLLFAELGAVRGDAAVMLKKWRVTNGEWREENGVIRTEEDWQKAKRGVSDADVIVDALLGTGLNGPVVGLLQGVIEEVNALHHSRRIVAVDMPSGLPSDTGKPLGPAVRAHLTVTFTAPKLGQLLPPNCEHVGQLEVRPIGSPVELLEGNPEHKMHLLEPKEFAALPFERNPGAHKGDFGHALIVAGSRGKSGAAVLAAWGALRAGAGLVTVATAEQVQPVVAAGLPELMTEALPGTDAGTLSVRSLDYGKVFELLKGKNAVAMGPGLSTHLETQQFIRRVVAECELPQVLDADGLNAFADRAGELKQRKSAALCVTPHPGEMARLLGCTTDEVQSRRLEVALQAACDWNAYVVLKGYRSVVAAPDGRAFINPTGNPGMATGGTGDVLTGILAGLTAQFGIAQWERVLGLGVYLHGLAGDIAAEEVGQAPLMAMDLIRALPQAFRQISGAGP